MNIFVLDRDPVLAAQYHCDKHVPKMIVESAQMLSSALWSVGIQAPYLSAYKNHPCTKWVSESNGNFFWLYQLAITLCSEYSVRFGKTHKSEAVLIYCWKEFLKSKPFPGNIVDITPFKQCMPEKYKSDDVVFSYRRFYNLDKSSFAKWDRCLRGTPDWFSTEEKIAA